MAVCNGRLGRDDGYTGGGTGPVHGARAAVAVSDASNPVPPRPYYQYRRHGAVTDVRSTCAWHALRTLSRHVVPHCTTLYHIVPYPPGV